MLRQYFQVIKGRHGEVSSKSLRRFANNQRSTDVVQTQHIRRELRLHIRNLNQHVRCLYESGSRQLSSIQLRMVKDILEEIGNALDDIRIHDA
jgi:hypothetical protein